MRLLGARDIEYHIFENQFFLLVRVWVVGADCGVEDSMFFQPDVDCVHKFTSFIAVETPNSTKQQLYVHRFPLWSSAM